MQNSYIISMINCKEGIMRSVIMLSGILLSDAIWGAKELEGYGEGVMITLVLFLAVVFTMDVIELVRG